MSTIASQPRADPRWLVLGAGAAAAACGVVAVLSPAVALAASLGLVFAAIAFESLPAGLALFAALTFFERLPGAEGLPVAKVAVVVLVLAALRRSGAPLLFRERPVLASVAVFFVAWASASVLWAVDSGSAAAEAFRLALGVAIVFVVFAGIREQRHVHWVVWGFVAGAVLSALAGLAGIAAPVADAPDRLAGGVGDPNILAAFLVPALVMAAFGLGAVQTPLSRWLLLGSIAVLTLALVLTQSRGGLIAVGASFVFAVVFGGRVRPHVLAVSLALSAVFLTYYAQVASPDARERITHLTSGGGTGRLDIWSVAGQAVVDHPVRGVGAGNFTAVEPIYAGTTINLPHVRFVLDEPRVVHNTFLEVLTELGVVGLASFAALLLASFVLGRWAIAAFARAGDVHLELLARGVLVGTLSMLVALVFISGQAKEQLWILVGVLIALPSLAHAGPRPSRDPRLRGHSPTQLTS